MAVEELLGNFARIIYILLEIDELDGGWKMEGVVIRVVFIGYAEHADLAFYTLHNALRAVCT